jgi:hypothetical protein
MFAGEKHGSGFETDDARRARLFAVKMAVKNTTRRMIVNVAAINA